MRRKKKPLDLRPGNARGRRKLCRALKRTHPWYKVSGTISGRMSSSASRHTFNYQYAVKSQDVSSLFNCSGTATGRLKGGEVANTPKPGVSVADFKEEFLRACPMVRAWIEALHKKEFTQ